MVQKSFNFAYLKCVTWIELQPTPLLACRVCFMVSNPYMLNILDYTNISIYLKSQKWDYWIEGCWTLGIIPRWLKTILKFASLECLKLLSIHMHLWNFVNQSFDSLVALGHYFPQIPIHLIYYTAEWVHSAKMLHLFV